jgi:hypothetical protein
MIAATIQMVKLGLSPTAAARQLHLGRSTVHRKISRAAVEAALRPYHPRSWKVLS